MDFLKDNSHQFIIIINSHQLVHSMINNRTLLREKQKRCFFKTETGLNGGYEIHFKKLCLILVELCHFPTKGRNRGRVVSC